MDVGLHGWRGLAGSSAEHTHRRLNALKPDPGTYGLDGFIKILNQLATAKSFDEALQKSVGLTQNEFYVKSAGYVFSVFQSTWPYR